MGYYIDAISDVLGGACLVLGCLFHFYKQRPFPSTPIRSNICLSSSTSDGGSEETELMILNVEDDQSSPGIHSPSTTINEINNNNLFETKKKIVLTLILFSLRYGLSAIFWDRNVHAYEDLLDSKADTLQKQVRIIFNLINYELLFFLLLGFTIKYITFSINYIDILFMEIFMCT